METVNPCNIRERKASEAVDISEKQIEKATQHLKACGQQNCSVLPWKKNVAYQWITLTLFIRFMP